MEIQVEKAGRRVVVKCATTTEMARKYFELCVKENDDLMKLFLELGADPDANDGEAMKKAVENGDLGKVKVLCEYKANADVDLSEAIRNGYVDVVAFLFEKGAKIQQSYLKTAIASESCKMIEVIMDQGGVEVTEEDVFNAIKMSSSVAKKLLSYKAGGFLLKRLEEAIEQADYDTTSLLLCFFRDNDIQYHDAKINYEKMVNVASTKTLNDMILLLKQYRLSLRGNWAFYKKASLETLELLGILKANSYETILQNAMKAGNKELAIQILDNSDVDTTKLF